MRADDSPPAEGMLRSSTLPSTPGEATLHRRVPTIVMNRAPTVPQVWTRYDALLYNLMSMNPAVMLILPFLTAAAYYIGGSFIAAIALCGAFCCAEALVYAFLASSMPRSGGDYYYQTRLLSGTVGSVFGFACFVLGGTIWMAIACWLAANVAVGPALVILGQLGHIPSLIALGTSVQSGGGMFLLSLFVIGWAAYINLKSPRTYLRLQRVLWIVGAAAVLAPLIMLLASSPRSLGDSPPFVAAAAESARLGFSQNRVGVTFGATLALVPVAAFWLIYPCWSVYHVGEMREAGRLRHQVLTMVGAEAITIAISMAVVWVVTSRFGGERLAAAAYLFVNDRAHMPFPTLPIFWFADGHLWPAGVAALCLAVFFNALFWMWVPDIPLAASRVMAAMSTGRRLPRWLGELSGPHQVPATAVFVFSLMCLVPVAVFAYTGLWRLSMVETMLNGMAFAVTCAVAATLPYLRRETYRRSTAAPHELFRVPVITLCGVAFVGFAGFVFWRFAVDDGLVLGQQRLVAWSIFVGLYAVSLALTLSFQLFLRRRETLEVEVVYRRVVHKPESTRPNG